MSDYAQHDAVKSHDLRDSDPCCIDIKDFTYKKL